jgi:2-oxoglutarate ferredoxin oxidoreductase subunit alpha
MVEDADIVVVAFGLLARVIKRSVIDARKHGVKAGLIRPMTLWPFPDEHIKAVTDTCKVILSMEISMGQMIQDIRLAVEGKVPVEFYGRIGFLPNPEELTQEIIAVAERKGL